MPSRVTRSGREVRNSSTKQSKLDALELLVRQRRGEKVDIGIKEDEPLFEEVDEEELRRTRKGNFIEDAESGEEDSDLDFIDDDGDYGDEPEPDGEDDQPRSNSRKRDRSKSKSKNAPELDSRQRSMKSFLGASKPKGTYSSPVIGSSSKKPQVDEEDILKQMLYDVPKNRSAPSQKPIKVTSVVRPNKTEANYRPVSAKRTRNINSSVEAQASTSNLGDKYDHDWQDDALIGASTKKIKYESTTPNQKLSDKNFIVEDDDDYDDGTNDPGVMVVPLNDDLKSNLEFKELDDGRKFAHLYWYDCCEDQSKFPGTVYLFGRIYATTQKRYVSCCTVVKNIMRTCYLLIAEDSTYEQAVGEFTHIIAKQHKIKNFSCQKVTKKYAFSSDQKVPLEADYVQISYQSNQPTLPSNLKGQTFSCILNVNQSPMEKFILDLKLRGPCWLKLIEPVAPDNQLTWSKIELVIENPENLVVEENTSSMTAPYFSIFSICIRTYPNPMTHHNEIIAITGMVNTSFNLDQCLKRTNKASGHFMLMTKPASGHKELKLPYDFHVALKKFKITRFELVDSERDLLLKFLEKFNNFDPDIVVGHDLINFDYETLVMRMKAMKVGAWSNLGRFKRSELPSTKAAFRYMFSGRVMCDIRTSAMELIHARSYDLTELTKQVLQRSRVDYNHTALVEAFKSSEGLINMLEATWHDNDSIFSILVEINVIPLALKITNITGNILSRTLSAGRSERNEFLLLHAFHEDNFICPEKHISSKFNKKFIANQVSGEAVENDVAPIRKKAAYAGGLVLEPKAGYYDNCILLMDFNSLYPSIIREFNICFSTVKKPTLNDAADQGSEIIAQVPDDSAPDGILPTQLRHLVDRRRKVKQLLAETNLTDQKMMLDIEQKALKLTANSMYGCLGFEQSRFYAKHLASLVTFKGREILMNTKAMVEKLGYEVIYGDTDSLMINSKLVDYDEVIQRGNSIKAEINRTFKLLEIDIDGVYKPLLLLKKKNYAGAALKKLPDGQIVTSIETKGLDTVRRDRAVIAKEAGEKVLSIILSGEKEIDQLVEDIHNYLKELGVKVKSGELGKEKFLISKQLNRNPEDYRDTKGLGHVTLALRHNRNNKKTKKMKAGDTVEYVICLDGTTESANQRAYTLEELAEEPDKLQIDYEYYLCQQIHPVMTRICDKLPVTNAYVLAEMLGVENSSMIHIRRDESDTTRRDELCSRGEARYNSCKPLVIVCPNCNLPDEIRSRLRQTKENKSNVELSLSTCSQCGVRYAMKSKSIVVQIIALIRQLTIEVYNSRYNCENIDCNNSTRNLFRPLTLDGLPQCELCQSQMLPEMDDRKMDLQLSFVKHLFDLKRLGETANFQKPSDDTRDLYESCFREVDYALKQSFTNNIDTYSVFSMICSGGNQ